MLCPQLFWGSHKTYSTFLQNCSLICCFVCAISLLSICLVVVVVDYYATHHFSLLLPSPKCPSLVSSLSLSNHLNYEKLCLSVKGDYLPCFMTTEDKVLIWRAGAFEWSISKQDKTIFCNKCVMKNI